VASAPGDALRNDIFHTFGTWQVPDDTWNSPSERELFGKSVQRKGNVYLKLDLLTSLPAVFWDRLEEKRIPLADQINQAFDEDKVIGFDGGLTWGELDPPPISIQLNNFINQVTDVVQKLGSLVVNLASKALQVGLVAFLRLANIDADTFQKAIDTFRRFGDIVTDIARSPLAFARNLIEGGKQGFVDYAAGFPDNIKEAAFKWLFGKLDQLGQQLPPVPETLDVPSVTLYLLKAVGLTWPTIKDRLVARLPGPAQGPALAIAQTLLRDPLTVDSVKERLAEFNDSLTSAADQLTWDSISQKLQEGLPEKLKEWAVEVTPELILMVLPGGAAIKGIWNTWQFLKEETSRLTALLEAVGGALAAAARLAAQVAGKVMAGLQAVTQLLLNLIIKLLHLDKLANKLRDLLARVLAWLREKVNQFIDWLLGRCGACRRAKEKGGTPAKRQGTCWLEGTTLEGLYGKSPIDLATAGTGVPLPREDERAELGEPYFITREEEQLRVVFLTMEYANGFRIDISLLRPVEWLEECKAAVGRRIGLDLRDQGIFGEALVTAIAPCPPLPTEPCQLVTGTFRHNRAVTLDLEVEGEPKPLGVTPEHLIWSVDRAEWVPALQLRPGERLRGRERIATVVGLTWREHEEPVFNIEVDGDHVYRVGEQGLLVHNASAGMATANCSAACDFDFDVGLLPDPNPNSLVSVKVSGDPSTEVGVYVLMYNGAVKVGSTGGSKTFRTRYSLSDPEGGCNIWYEIKQVTWSAAQSRDPKDAKTCSNWSPRAQRRYDEEFVDRLISNSAKYRSSKGSAPVKPYKWMRCRYIYGYETLPATFGFVLSGSASDDDMPDVT
jgi:hypothetical protein